MTTTTTTIKPHWATQYSDRHSPHAREGCAAFDTVWAHLRRQGVRATNAGVGCVYLTEDGLRCAVGCLIPPGHPAERFSGNVHELIEAMPGVDLPLFGRHRDLLAQLQDVHDALEPQDWNGAMRAIARMVGFPAVEPFRWSGLDPTSETVCPVERVD